MKCWGVMNWLWWWGWGWGGVGASRSPVLSGIPHHDQGKRWFRRSTLCLCFVSVFYRTVLSPLRCITWGSESSVSCCEKQTNNNNTNPEADWFIHFQIPCFLVLMQKKIALRRNKKTFFLSFVFFKIVFDSNEKCISYLLVKKKWLEQKSIF